MSLLAATDAYPARATRPQFAHQKKKIDPAGTTLGSHAFVCGLAEYQLLSYRKKSPEYLRNAAACRKLAKGARAASEQATYCELAQHWEGMAEIENRIIATLSAITADISRAA